MKCIFFLFKNAALHTAQQHRVSSSHVGCGKLRRKRIFKIVVDDDGAEDSGAFPCSEVTQGKRHDFWEEGGNRSVHEMKRKEWDIIKMSFIRRHG